MNERVVSRNGIDLYVRDRGVGAPTLFLHGWPDTGSLWNEVVAALNLDTLRCIVPDLRGCGRSSKPTETRQYLMHELVADVISVIADLGVEKVNLVGHDWGANLAWATAAFVPERVARLAVLSVGHPTSFRSAGLAQLIKSWYTLLFAHEGLGEAFLRKNNYEAIREWLGHPRPDELIEELERDGQMTAHLLWYRANIPPQAFVSDPPVLPPILAPTLGIWSLGDHALSESQMTNSAAFCRNGFRYEQLGNFGHWTPLEAPAIVAAVLTDFLSSPLT